MQPLNDTEYEWLQSHIPFPVDRDDPDLRAVLNLLIRVAVDIEVSNAD